MPNPRRVEFKFDMDDRVMTAVGTEGIVKMLAYDHGGKQYAVSTAQVAWTWFQEDQLEPLTTNSRQEGGTR